MVSRRHVFGWVTVQLLVFHTLFVAWLIVLWTYIVFYDAPSFTGSLALFFKWAWKAGFLPVLLLTRLAKLDGWRKVFRKRTAYEFRRRTYSNTHRTGRIGLHQRVLSGPISRGPVASAYLDDVDLHGSTLPESEPVGGRVTRESSRDDIAVAGIADRDGGGYASYPSVIQLVPQDTGLTAAYGSYRSSRAGQPRLQRLSTYHSIAAAAKAAAAANPKSQRDYEDLHGFRAHLSPGSGGDGWSNGFDNDDASDTNEADQLPRASAAQPRASRGRPVPAAVALGPRESDTEDNETISELNSPNSSRPPSTVSQLQQAGGSSRSVYSFPASSSVVGGADKQARGPLSPQRFVQGHHLTRSASERDVVLTVHDAGVTGAISPTHDSSDNVRRSHSAELQVGSGTTDDQAHRHHRTRQGHGRRRAVGTRRRSAGLLGPVVGDRRRR